MELGSADLSSTSPVVAGSTVKNTVHTNSPGVVCLQDARALPRAVLSPCLTTQLNIERFGFNSFGKTFIIEIASFSLNARNVNLWK
ncbi:hypothetical protein PoB_004758300 [Plakobranchus ocellatus]|uniref:Uncharacterized protein n=1 Tax=Plakobranchus ocellatus TaxID=259542 RepID=A0AAV4BPN6_9GAST|nr:hypothetical protein PoB_004758300 [Plakobranchus ocellatus]